MREEPAGTSIHATVVRVSRSRTGRFDAVDAAPLDDERHRACSPPDRPTALAPGTTYDPKIPTLKAVLGYDTGERITPPEDLTAYLKALHAAAPERTVLLEYARTWEGRPLSVLIVASPERIAGLDAIKRDLQRLADPRGAVAGRRRRDPGARCRSSCG